MERVDVLVDITSSDDEKDHKAFFNQDQQCNSPGKNSSSSTKPSENETNKKLTITVEDTPQTINNNKSTKIVINIDEVTSSQEVNDDQTPNKKQNNCGIVFDEDFTLEFSQLIELCLKYEFSDGMVRILKRNLIPVYKSAEKGYIESTVFQCFLEDIIMKMQRDPNHKFSCLKSVCENLKKNAVKKRVNLVTLSSEVSEHRKRKSQPQTIAKVPRVSEVIDLDEDVCIDLDEEQDDVIFIDEKANSSTTNETATNIQGSPCHTSGLMTVEEVLMKSKIHRIEEEIKACKTTIESFDNMEVADETDNNSPYIVADKCKSRIVKLYKEYCSLTGAQPFERRCREVIINVSEGPPGPAKKLQNWLSENSKEDGDPAFPDFTDVLKCVTTATEEDNLCWTKTQILKHAQMLFTQCGKALQKRRQKREWRDLVYKMDVSRDPADEDPSLLAKLEANRELAKKKENEILQHYASLPSYNLKAPKGKVTVLQPSSITDQNQATNASTEADADSGFFYPEVPVVVAENLETYTEYVETQIDVKPLLLPNPIDPGEEIVCSDSEDYSTSEDEQSNVESNELTNVSSSSVLNGQAKDNNSVESISNKEVESLVNENLCDTKVKQEVKTEPNENKTPMTAEDTLKILLQFDETDLEFAQVKTTVFDFDPTVTVEILTSDSDSDCEILPNDAP